MTKRENEIKKSIVISLFWGIVALGLIVSRSVHGFWMTVCWIWFFYHVFSIYTCIRKYGKEARQSQQKYKESQEEFKKKYDNIFNKNKYKNTDELFEEYRKLFEEQFRQQQRQASAVKSDMTITDAYKLMKLTYSDTPENIKKRYRQLAMQWHPDKFATESKSKQDVANRNFQKLNKAYNVIKTHKKIA